MIEKNEKKRTFAFHQNCFKRVLKFNVFFVPFHICSAGYFRQLYFFLNSFGAIERYAHNAFLNLQELQLVKTNTVQCTALEIMLLFFITPLISMKAFRVFCILIFLTQ